ncbi:hypothetical protein ACFST9_02470 [Hymenobacter monticola]|uniref:TonB C-terminal domain-containing protein n=1 Tax=Hymenobacter monticola TaxID=1705399 RepID=A0ABY4B961_9BACT|nr:hypothetical protein [Hymenobacter monticola]UOE33175.1 hypothetical protein MTP16_18865 [Hymenobacter monticola]
MAQVPAVPRQLPQQPAAWNAQPATRSAPALSQTAWRFETMPVAEFVDEQPGAIRFRLVVNAAGQLDSVVTVSSNVSARQEALCRQALGTVRFVNNQPTPAPSVGFYTFKFSVR